MPDPLRFSEREPSLPSWLRAQTGTGSTTNDINILNFALRLENLESAFYQQGLAKFASKDFQNSATVQNFGGTKIGANIYAYLQAIGQHEQDHVTKLIQTIVGLGGTPQPVDCYNFGFKTADSFLQIAQAIENTGVMAYDGAIAHRLDQSESADAWRRPLRRSKPGTPRISTCSTSPYRSPLRLTPLRQ